MCHASVSLFAKYFFPLAVRRIIPLEDVSIVCCFLRVVTYMLDRLARPMLVACLLALACNLQLPY